MIFAKRYAECPGNFFCRPTAVRGGCFLFMPGDCTTEVFRPEKTGERRVFEPEKGSSPLLRAVLREKSEHGHAMVHDGREKEK